MEQDRPHSPPTARCDRVQRRAPALAIFTLALTPVPDDGLEIAGLTTRRFFNTAEIRIGFREFPPPQLDRILVARLNGSLNSFVGSFERLLCCVETVLDDGMTRRVDRVHHADFLKHRFRYFSADDQATKLIYREWPLQQVRDIFAEHVIEISDAVSLKHFETHREF